MGKPLNEQQMKQVRSTQAALGVAPQADASEPSGHSDSVGQASRDSDAAKTRAAVKANEASKQPEIDADLSPAEKRERDYNRNVDKPKPNALSTGYTATGMDEVHHYEKRAHGHPGGQ